MRISLLTRVNAFLLLVAVIGVAGSVYLGLQKLQQPFALNDAYFQTIESVSVKTRLLINNYLDSGDASALAAAQDFLDKELPQQLSQLPEGIQQAMQPSINSLSASLDVDLRAAGKLSGNPQSLLLQNERELYASLDSLQDYIAEAESTAPSSLREQYQQVSRELSQLVEQRGLVRSDYFATLKEALIAGLQERSQQIVELAEQLKELPLLGVKEEAQVDEFAAMMGFATAESTDAVDKGEEIINEINYLSKRYKTELSNTLGVIQAGLSAKDKVDGLVVELENRARDSKQIIDKMRDQVQQQVLLGVSLFLLILVLVGLATVALQFSVISGIKRVNGAIVRLSSGDFSSPMEWQSRFVELTALVDCANQMQKYLNQLVREIRTEINSVKSVSDGVSELAMLTDERSKQQVLLTDEVSSSMGELLSSFQRVADHAKRGSELTGAGQESVLSGWRQMRDLEKVISDLATEVSDGVGMLEQLQGDTENISTVLNVIVSIAEQTNLLALNAAIEAARAGDHGRGFAVVADEVRQLAQRTSESTKEIRSIIEGLGTSSSSVSAAMLAQQKRAEQAVTHSHEVGNMLQSVVETIDQTGVLAQEIASATSEQVSEAQSLMERLGEVQASANETQEQTKASNQQSEKLMGVSHSLDKLVDRYQV